MRATLDRPEGLRPPLLRRVTPAQLQALDYAIAMLVAVIALAHLRRWLPSGGHLAGTVGLGSFLGLLGGGALPIAIRRRAPLLALSISAGSLVLANIIGKSFNPDPFIAFPTFTVASQRERRQSLTALIATLCAFFLASLVAARVSSSPQNFSSLLGSAAVFAIAAWFVGESVRVRREYTRGLAEQAAQRTREALERAQRGVAEERLRIARELHDVVAHSLSVIAVQSGVGRHVIDSQPEEAKKALAAVETTSRSALEELRRMLGILRRNEDDSPNLAPAPGAGDLASLIGQIQATGVEVTLSVEDDAAAGLAPSMDLCVYRIVQEALTNVVKHAGPASVEVELRRDGDALVIEICDDGKGSPGAADASDGRFGDHHGIVGMRERVAIFGGEFSAGGRAQGGFRVFARLPYDKERV